MYLTNDRSTNRPHGQTAASPSSDASSPASSSELAACLVGGGGFIPRPCEITDEGLLAAEKYLREHSEEYDNRAPLGSHRRLIATLLSEALRASHITFRMPSEFR